MENRARRQTTDAPGFFEQIRELGRHAARYGRDLKDLFELEMREGLRTLLLAAIRLAAALLLSLFALALLTGALTALLASLLHSWGWALLVAGLIYAGAAAVLAITAARALRERGPRFRRTRDQIARDKEWLKQKLAA